MAVKNREDKIKKASSKTPSQWKESAKWRRANRAWLNKSFEIALKILDSIEEKGWKQKDLAVKMGVTPQQISKIVKGKENLSLSTIAKLEEVLQVKLIQIPTFESRTEFDLIASDMVELMNEILVGSLDRILLEDIAGSEFVPQQNESQPDPSSNEDGKSPLYKISTAA